MTKRTLTPRSKSHATRSSSPRGSKSSRSPRTSRSPLTHAKASKSPKKPKAAKKPKTPKTPGTPTTPKSSTRARGGKTAAAKSEAAAALDESVQLAIEKLAAKAEKPAHLLDTAALTGLAIKLSSFSVSDLKVFLMALAPGRAAPTSNVKSELVAEAQREFMETLDAQCMANLDTVDLIQISKSLNLKLTRGEECATLRSILGPAGRIAIAMHNMKTKAQLASQMVQDKVYGAVNDAKKKVHGAAKDAQDRAYGAIKGAKDKIVGSAKDMKDRAIGAVKRLADNKVFAGLWTVINTILSAAVALGKVAVKLVGTTLTKCVMQPQVCAMSIMALYAHFCVRGYENHERLCDLIKKHACDIIKTVAGVATAGFGGQLIGGFICSLANFNRVDIKVNGGSAKVSHATKEQFIKDSNDPKMISQTEAMFDEYIEMCEDQACIDDFEQQRKAYRADPMRFMTRLI
jgi:hypothetical protein